MNCKALKKVIFPKSLKFIGYMLFESSIFSESSIIMIGKDAFNCTSLVNLALHGYFALITQEIDESNDRIDISTKITFLPKYSYILKINTVLFTQLKTMEYNLFLELLN